MSGHGHNDAGEVHDADHDDQHESSSDDFPADEPRSPGWLPLLGGALFLAGIFAFVVIGAGGKTAEELAKDAAAANPSAAPTPVQVAAPGSPPAQRPAVQIPPGAAMPANRPQFPHPPGN
ncbi:MAG TPA: hypothetical protein VK745_06480 [Polyangiaceae bacterium]|nr:hypothetical protein [Polyangiaceae bacterium]